MLGGVGAQFESCNADAASDLAVFRNHVADNGSFAAAGENATAALEGAVADADVFDSRAVLVFHRVRPLGALAGNTVISDGENAAIDGDVAGAVDVDAVSAGGLPVVVGHLEVDVMHENAVVVVEMAVPELRILERNAFDLDVLRAFDKRKPGAGQAGIRKAFDFGPVSSRRAPIWACPRRRGFHPPVSWNPSQFFALMKAGVKFSMKWPSMRVRCAGKFERSVEHLRTAPSVRRRLTFGLKKRAPETKNTLGDDNGASALGGKLIDGGLDGLGVNGGIVGDRAGLGNEKLTRRRDERLRDVRPKRSRSDEGGEAAARVALDRHQQILWNTRSRTDQSLVQLLMIFCREVCCPMQR